MHKSKTAGGTQPFSSSGWYDPDPIGTWKSNRRRLRAGGGAVCAAPAAELLLTPLGIFGKTWLLNPERITNFPPGIGFTEAIKQFEAAERIGHSAALWYPLQQELTAQKPFHSEVMFGLEVHFAYFGGPQGGICVCVDTVLLATDDGCLALFPDLPEARVAGWLKASAVAG